MPGMMHISYYVNAINHLQICMFSGIEFNGFRIEQIEYHNKSNTKYCKIRFEEFNVFELDWISMCDSFFCLFFIDTRNTRIKKTKKRSQKKTNKL